MPGLRIVFRGRCDQGNGPGPDHDEHPRCPFPWGGEMSGEHGMVDGYSAGFELTKIELELTIFK